jgi:hypothetical protein
MSDNITLIQQESLSTRILHAKEFLKENSNEMLVTAVVTRNRGLCVFYEGCFAFSVACGLLKLFLSESYVISNLRLPQAFLVGSRYVDP